jgi:transcriptional regulator with XRE-family HTH domain
MDRHHQQLAQRIRDLAEERGVTLTHLADFSGRSRSHFWDVIAGRKSPTLKWLVSVAEALKVEPWMLLAQGAAPVSRRGRRKSR